jgi:two-component system, NarL family, nitrate/nitrite response regulator NarL
MNSKNCYTVIIIDDHPLFRKGVTELLNSQSDFEVIGEAASGKEGIDLSLELKPDIVLTDLNMKGMNGIQVISSLKKTDIDSINIILTVSDTEENFLTALRSGADGYLLKDTEPELIIEKIRCAINGEVIIDDNLTNLLTNSIRDNKPQTPTDYSMLSEREVEIVKLIVKGMSNKLIARELGITEGTVKVHVKNTLRKLNLSSRLEAALWAIAHGCTD